VAHSLHTPLMAVTNAISGIIIRFEFDDFGFKTRVLNLIVFRPDIGDSVFHGIRSC
jgi:hypothetical protein